MALKNSTTNGKPPLRTIVRAVLKCGLLYNEYCTFRSLNIREQSQSKQITFLVLFQILCKHTLMA